jgi:hypothetical protein
MSNFDHDPHRERRDPNDPTLRTTSRRAMWSAAGMLAIVGMLFVVFYGINAQQTRQGATSAASGPAATDTTGRR